MGLIEVPNLGKVAIGRATMEEVAQVQEIENEVWGPDAVYPKSHPNEGQRFSDIWGPNGLAFTKYDELYRTFPAGIEVATNNNGHVLAYNAFIRLSLSDLRVKLPSYDMDLRRHVRDGAVCYVVNHTTRPGVSGLSGPMMSYMQTTAGHLVGSLATPSWPEHPYLFGEKGERFWGKHGFVPVESTRTNEWSPVEGGKPVKMVVKMWQL